MFYVVGRELDSKLSLYVSQLVRRQMVPNVKDFGSVHFESPRSAFISYPVSRLVLSYRSCVWVRSSMRSFVNKLERCLASGWVVIIYVMPDVS